MSVTPNSNSSSASWLVLGTELTFNVRQVPSEVISADLFSVYSGAKSISPFGPLASRSAVSNLIWTEESFLVSSCSMEPFRFDLSDFRE